MIGVELLCRVGGELLEGPTWDPRTDTLRFVDIRAGQLLALDVATGNLRQKTVGRSCSAWIGRKEGGSVVACSDSLLFLDSRWREEHRLPLEPDLPANRANDAKCDPHGRLWVGTMSEAEGAPAGALYRVERGTTTRVLDGIAVSNGLGWSPDGRRMYYIDSPTRRVDAFDYELATGTPSNRRCLVDTQDIAGSPDGMAIDAAGCPWVAFWDGGAVHRFSPDGEHLASVAVGVARPTSCAFIGPKLDMLAITTARAPDGSGGDVYACSATIPGLHVADYEA